MSRRAAAFVLRVTAGEPLAASFMTMTVEVGLARVSHDVTTEGMRGDAPTAARRRTTEGLLSARPALSVTATGLCRTPPVEPASPSIHAVPTTTVLPAVTPAPAVPPLTAAGRRTTEGLLSARPAFSVTATSLCRTLRVEPASPSVHAVPTTTVLAAVTPAPAVPPLTVEERRTAEVPAFARTGRRIRRTDQVLHRAGRKDRTGVTGAPWRLAFQELRRGRASHSRTGTSSRSHGAYMETAPHTAPAPDSSRRPEARDSAGLTLVLTALLCSGMTPTTPAATSLKKKPLDRSPTRPHAAGNVAVHNQ